jgi:hypothetical protein
MAANAARHAAKARAKLRELFFFDGSYVIAKYIPYSIFSALRFALCVTRTAAMQKRALRFSAEGLSAILPKCLATRIWRKVPNGPL